MSYPALSGLMFSSKPELELVMILLLSVGGPATPIHLQGRNVSSLTSFQVLSYFTLLSTRTFDPEFPSSEGCIGASSAKNNYSVLYVVGFLVERALNNPNNLSLLLKIPQQKKANIVEFWFIYCQSTASKVSVRCLTRRLVHEVGLKVTFIR